MADPARAVTNGPTSHLQFDLRADQILARLMKPHSDDEDYLAMGELVIALCENAGVEPHRFGRSNGHPDVSWHRSLMKIWDKDPEEAERALTAIRLAFG